MTDNILIDVRGLKMYFPVTRGIIRRNVGYIKAIDGISFFIRKSETLGLVGESGCGETTLGRSILQLHRPTSGEVLFKGVGDISKMEGEALRKLRRAMQMIFNI